MGAAQVSELGWHSSTELGPLRLVAVPAVHESGRSATDRGDRLWAGWLVKDATRQVYFSGDTAHGRFFEHLRTAYGPTDLAFIAAGAYGPEHLLQRYHLTPEQAWAAGRTMCASKVVPIHWGVMTNSAEPLEEPLTRFARAAGVPPESFARIGQFVRWADVDRRPCPFTTTTSTSTSKA